MLRNPKSEIQNLKSKILNPPVPTPTYGGGYLSAAVRWNTQSRIRMKPRDAGTVTACHIGGRRAVSPGNLLRNEAAFRQPQDGSNQSNVGQRQQHDADHDADRNRHPCRDSRGFTSFAPSLPLARKRAWSLSLRLPLGHWLIAYHTTAHTPWAATAGQMAHSSEVIHQTACGTAPVAAMTLVTSASNA